MTPRSTASAARPPEAAPPRPAIPIAVTLGDPAGIGPDIALQAWHARKAQNLPPFAVYGEAGALRQRARALGLEVPVAVIERLEAATSLFVDALPVVRPAAPVRTADAGIVAAIEEATAAALAGTALALVTNPIAKRSLAAVSLPYPGHTAFLGQLAERHTGCSPIRPIMMLAAPELRVVPATVHIPLARVPGALSRTLILDTGRIVARAMVEDFGVPRPRIAVAGLNPHAGEDGLIGSEEVEIIAPALAELKAEGLAVTGPRSADSMFHPEARAGYDVAIAMYHDQALIPLKTLAFDSGVNATLGLPFVRTSPDHGTAYALAGTGKARPTSFIAALRLAAEMGMRRREGRRARAKASDSKAQGSAGCGDHGSAALGSLKPGP
jgi:4-hydroxythreonine-4-phosphate dehydrogenase